MSSRALQGFRTLVLTAAKIPSPISMIAAGGIIGANWIITGDMASLSHRLAHQTPNEQFETSVLFYVSWMGAIIVPAVLVMGAAIWTKEAFRKAKILKLSEKAEDPDFLKEVSWEQFEEIVAAAFAKRGHQCKVTQAGADGGIDVVTQKDGRTWYIQCKHWKSKQVGVDVVRSFYGVIQADKVAGGYICTSGEFTGEARRFAEKVNIKLINGQALANLVRLGKGSEVATGSLKLATEAFYRVDKMVCPACSSPMVRRRAMSGPHEGKRFWGCSQFPECHAIVDEGQ